jgi:endonuclease-3
MKPNYRARCARTNRLLQEAYGKPTWPGQQNPLEVLLRTVITDLTSAAGAEKAMKALLDHYKTAEKAGDSSADTIAKTLKSGGLATQKGKQVGVLIKTLKKAHGSASLDFIKTMSVREAMRALESIDGVGPKVGASVILYSLGREICPVDAHILRVLQRMGIVPNNSAPEAAFELLQPLVPNGQSYAFHENLIRLGKEVCKSGKPKCTSCPVEKECRFPSKNIPRTR